MSTIVVNEQTSIQFCVTIVITAESHNASCYEWVTAKVQGGQGVKLNNLIYADHL